MVYIFISPTLIEKKMCQYFPSHPSQPRKEHIAKMVHQHTRLIIPLKFFKRKCALYEDLEQDWNDLNLFSLWIFFLSCDRSLKSQITEHRGAIRREAAIYIMSSFLRSQVLDLCFSFRRVSKGPFSLRGGDFRFHTHN